MWTQTSERYLTGTRPSPHRKAHRTSQVQLFSHNIFINLYSISKNRQRLWSPFHRTYRQGVIVSTDTAPTVSCFCFSPTRLPIWFCLRSPLIRMSEWSIKCFHTTDEFNQGPFYPGPGPAVSVKTFTSASLANMRLESLKTRTGGGRSESTFTFKALEQKTISLQKKPSVNTCKLPEHVCGLLALAAVFFCHSITRDRAWQLHHQWSRGLIPFGRSAPINGHCGSLAPLSGYRWHQSHRSVWTLLSIRPEPPSSPTWASLCVRRQRCLEEKPYIFLLLCRTDV